MFTGESIFITVFTPTYNRAKYLHRGYASLLKQTYKHFEWVIIDDGSTDNTKEVVDEFIKEGKMTSNTITRKTAVNILLIIMFFNCKRNVFISFRF
jgi:glycosyltransferase involved in cell wall biosynthesis